MTKVLDHGYLKAVESYGSDERIIEAARMSTNKGFLGWGPQDCSCAGTDLSDGVAAKDWDLSCAKCKGTGCVSGDEKLLAYLYNNKHSTPFEMAGLIIEVKAPILVFRQWHRHRTQSYNEMSARYTPLPDEDYIPSIERLLLNSKTNKQAGTADGARQLSAGIAGVFQNELRSHYEMAQKVYEWALENGIPKELARVHLPVARYSKMRAHANLRNWLAFLTLRMDPHAQWEIQQYANAIGSIIADRFPRTWELFLKGNKW